ncbi:response regulator transcription factor [Dehalogenimonas etheniformans]|uniref:DNA-binding response regulator n=1 Tax=Dehalogenimonas etheniformans TaxID=1536648 RepID=A0A2P5P5L6_9CHLR|nr:response regulator transcription factor [Dehalogenimonas etheniformans]PPD57577.1 DNA-binding response regulator [Dehalogenimonas etheniformans]QNT75915.1 response regulator transcription factor [Dehalogenimonas etheniformans]
MDVLIFNPSQKDTETITSVFDSLWPGSCTKVATTTEHALSVFEKSRFDLVIIVVNLRDICFDLVKDLRRFSDVPVVVIDGNPNEYALMKFIDLGADDYLVSPFKPLELLYHCKAIVRRAFGMDSDNEPLEVGLLRLDALLHRAEMGGQQIPLSRTESIVLSHLMKNAGRVVSHNSLARAIWGDETVEANGTIRTYIERLRKKLGDNPRNPSLILTETGYGYRLAKPFKLHLNPVLSLIVTVINMIAALPLFSVIDCDAL